MCGRFTHRLTWRELVALYRLTDGWPPFEIEQRYNVAPSQWVPIIRERDGKREIALLRWGFIPYWAKVPGHRPINARAETVTTAPTFRSAFKARRCIVLASGFYEWQKVGKGKQPYLIEHKDGSPLSLADCGSNRKLVPSPSRPSPSSRPKRTSCWHPSIIECR